MKHKELVLVTGGAGFIGSHLTDALLDKDYQVRVLDNLSRPTHNGAVPTWFNKKAKFIHGDVRRKQDWLTALKDVDYVYHLAAYMDYHVDFGKYIDTNIKSTALLYEVITRYKLPVKKIILASSQSVYGEGKYECSKHGVFYPQSRKELDLRNNLWDVVCPIDKTPARILAETETDEVHPQNPYAISKLASENLSINLGKTYAIPTVALRYSIVHGPRQSFRHFYSGALRDFSVRSVLNLQILTHEDAMQQRDFVNVYDVVDANLLVLDKEDANYQVFNVGRGKSTRVIDLANTVCKITGSSHVPKSTGAYRINLQRHSVMSIDKIQRLGYKPKRTLELGVKEYIDWLRQYPQSIRYWKKSYAQMIKEGAIKQ